MACVLEEHILVTTRETSFLFSTTASTLIPIQIKGKISLIGKVQLFLSDLEGN